MAIKYLAFNTLANALVDVAASGADIMLLGTGTGAGQYPQTAAGFTAGRTASPALTTGADQTVVAPYRTFAILPNGDAAQRIRIDRAAGTFTCGFLTYTDGGTYHSGGERIIDSDGTTVLFTRTNVDRNNDPSPATYWWTDMSANATSADPGTTVTTTGTHFFIELRGLPLYGGKLSTFFFDDGAGGGGATTTNLQLRITAGAATVDTAVMPVAAGGPPGGGGGALLFESNWDNSLGTGLDATFDGTKWDRTFAADALECLSVVSAASVGANTGTLSGYTGNVLRIQQRLRAGPGSNPWASKPQLPNIVAASQSHWVRFYFRDDETGTQHLHPICYPVGGDIQIVPWARQGTPSGMQLVLPYGQGYPNDSWVIRASSGGAQITFAQNTWYRYEYHLEYLTATTYRIHPRVYDAAGTLLYDSDDFYTRDFPFTTSLAAYHAGGGSDTITDIETSRTFSIGTEGPGSSPDTGEYFYHAKLALSTTGWIGA